MCPVNILFVINEGTPLGMFDEDFVTRHVCATTWTTTTTTMAVVIAETSALNIFAYKPDKNEYQIEFVSKNHTNKYPKIFLKLVSPLSPPL